MSRSDPKHPFFDHFIGVDVGKFHIVIYDSATCMIHEIENTRSAILTFFKSINRTSTSLVVCEASGGCEVTVLNCMSELGIAAHRANAGQIRSFIASLGTRAKTDAGDARAIALFAEERHKHLKLWDIPDKTQTRLKALVLRRDDLIATRVAEKNRASAPQIDKVIARSCSDMIAWLGRQIMKIEHTISRLITDSESLSRKCRILTAMPGIGSVSAWAILAHMPELGTCTRRKAASLAGLAPHPKDSGKMRGYRNTRGGRAQIKRAMFMPAMVAVRHDENLAKTYKALVANGKKKLVALTAVMRKMVVIANARIRDDIASQLS